MHSRVFEIRSEPWLTERLDAGEGATHDQRMNVRSALVGHRLEIDHVADHRVLERDAVGTKDLASRARDVERVVHVAKFAHAGVLRA